MMEDVLVSVIIPCRNEVKSIVQTVRAILNSHHKNLEVLVVDGMSDDGTRSLFGELTDEDSRVHVIDNLKMLTPYARNLGVKNAKGDYVLIVDSRNTLSRDYISILMSNLIEHPNVACVGGNLQHVHDSHEGRMISLAMESKFGVGMDSYRTAVKDSYVDTVAVPLYHRYIFKEIGFFDENLTRNQDDDFNFRVRRKGYQVLYVHEAKATYLVRGSFKKAFKQFQQYGYFKVYVNKKHGAVTTTRQLVPAGFLAFWASGIPIVLIDWNLLPWLGGVAALYMIMGLSLAGENLKLIDRFRVLAACFVLHTGYGTGYWMGIWDFMMNAHSPRQSMQKQTT